MKTDPIKRERREVLLLRVVENVYVSKSASNSRASRIRNSPPGNEEATMREGRTGRHKPEIPRGPSASPCVYIRMHAFMLRVYCAKE